MKLIAFCGGGSAGHIMPNIALIKELKNDYDIMYIGTNAIEKEICKRYCVDFYEIDTPKLVRGKLWKNFSIPYRLVKSINLTKKILKTTCPDLIFSKGGYVSLPVAIAAKKCNIPVITHESDRTPGLANKIISKFSTEYISTFPSVKGAVCTGTPMNRKLFTVKKADAKEYFGFDLRPVVLVFGGGSGAEHINKTLRKCVGTLCKDFNVLHICGKGNVVQSNIYGYKQVEFADMAYAYACSDFAVARCGSNSACELTAMNIPTLYIPLQGRHSRGDQIKNAEYFSSLGVCKVLNEDKLNETTLTKEIYELASDSKIRKALKEINFKCGNDNIIKIIKTVINRSD